jgi:hypothetical protein
MLTASGRGAATASGQVLFRGTMPVALSEIADGDHHIAIAGPNGVVACGQIARLGGAVVSNRLPATGATTSWLLAGLALGLALLAAGGGLRLQPTWRRYR